jgi:hypothetical protein
MELGNLLSSIRTSRVDHYGTGRQIERLTLLTLAAVTEVPRSAALRLSNPFRNIVDVFPRRRPMIVCIMKADVDD